MFVFMLWDLPDAPAVAEPPAIEVSLAGASFAQNATHPFAGSATYGHSAALVGFAGPHYVGTNARAARHSSANSNRVDPSKNTSFAPAVSQNAPMLALNAGEALSNQPAAIIDSIAPTLTQPVIDVLAQTLPNAIKTDTAVAPSTAAAVPEPSTLAMLGFGLLSLSWIGRKRRR